MGKYIEIAGGSITEIYEQNYNMYAGTNIITKAGKSVGEFAKEGISFNKFQWKIMQDETKNYYH